MLRIISCFTPLLHYSDTPILQGKGLCQGWNRFTITREMGLFRFLLSIGRFCALIR